MLSNGITLLKCTGFFFERCEFSLLIGKEALGIANGFT